MWQSWHCGLILVDDLCFVTQRTGGVREPRGPRLDISVRGPEWSLAREVSSRTGIVSSVAGNYCPVASTSHFMISSKK